MSKCGELPVESYSTASVTPTMAPRKKKFMRIKNIDEPMVTLYRNLFLQKWSVNIKPAELKKLDPRFIPHGNNLSRTLIRAKERVAQYKQHKTGECDRIGLNCTGPDCLNFHCSPFLSESVLTNQDSTTSISRQ